MVKSRKKYVYILGLGITFAQLLAVSQQTSNSASDASPAPILAPTLPQEDQASREQWVRLFELMGFKKQIEESFRIGAQAAHPQIEAQQNEMIAKNPILNAMKPEEKQKLKEIMNRFTEKSMSIYRADEMMDDMIPIYQKHLSRSDLEGMITFFQSPAGQHFVAHQADIAQEYTPIAMKRMQEPSRVNNDQLSNEIQELIVAAQKDQNASAIKAQTGSSSTTLLERIEKYALAFLSNYASGESPTSALKDVLNKAVSQ